MQNYALKERISASFSYFDSSATKEKVNYTYNNLQVCLTPYRIMVDESGQDPKDRYKTELPEKICWAKSYISNPFPDKFSTGNSFIVNSNMENYHLFRVMNSMSQESTKAKNYPELTAFNITRVDSNVKTSHNIEEQVKAYIEEKLCEFSLTGAAIKSLVAWGKRGCPITQEEIQYLDGLNSKITRWHIEFDNAEQNELASFTFSQNGTAVLTTDV